MTRKLTRLPALLLVCALLAGCQQPPQPTAPETTLPPETTVPVETVAYTTPPDGSEADVTCKGSYTVDSGADTVVATLGETELTNGVLRAFYWLEVTRYSRGGAEVQPDWSLPLDVQPCPIDTGVNSWQQYFLARALSTWHTAQALTLQSQTAGVPIEEAYRPNKDNHAIYLKDIPATQFLYGFNPGYQPNTLHQAYLDGIPGLLTALAEQLGYADGEAMAREAMGTELEDLSAAVELYNYGYMYLTTLSYYLEYSQEEMQTFVEENPQYADETPLVTLRHILLVPQGEDVTVDEEGLVAASQERWEEAEKEAGQLLKTWQSGLYVRESTFAELASLHSADPGSALTGGLYRNVRQGQLTKALDEWAFDAAREPGETAVVRSEYGVHLVYYSGSTTAGALAAQDALLKQKQSQLIAEAREAFPVTVNYGAIGLTDGAASISPEDVLYPDVAHERYPEVPVYLQQDYAGTMYGGYPVATHGCGITSMAMLATYLADDELTVPEMCAQFGRYCLESGTNFQIFNVEPATLGFYLQEFTRSADTAKAALEAGHVVVSLQHRGYWTRGGHFIVIEEIMEDGRVRVRDSNLYNYASISAHKEDLHGWDTVTARSAGYWIYQHKVTRIPACCRCGDPEQLLEGMMAPDYTCPKCASALLRRNTYLNYAPEA